MNNYSDLILESRKALLDLAPIFKRSEDAVEGGAIFLRDPRRVVGEEQLNGGAFVDLTEADWGLIEAYLLENERLFGITVEDLLTVDGVRLSPSNVYRKVVVKEQTAILTETANR